MINIGRWQFDFTDPVLIVLTLVLLFSFLLVLNSAFKRLFQRAPARALAVILLNTVAYTTVLLFLLEPLYSEPVEQSVTLITEGAELADVGSTGRANMYVAPGVDSSWAEEQTLTDKNWLLDTGQLPLREPALAEIEIQGYGLDQNQWKSFSDGLQIDFNPPALNGFTSMRWQRSLLEGETLVISGRYQAAAPGAIIELRLLDPANNIVDDSRIKSGQYFSVSTPVKARGNLEFSLQAWLNGAQQEVQLSEQLIPVESSAVAPLNIMIRQSSPSFETRALKNNAAANGHIVRVNTVISKGKTLEQSVNLPDVVETTLSPGLLADQDLLIMDGRTLASLPLTQRDWLNTAVENGLGLLVLADSDLLRGFDELSPNILYGFSLSSLPGKETMVHPRLLTRDAAQWQQPILTAAMRLNASNADVLIDDGKGRGLVVKRSSGLGSIGISLINHSHSWLTSGNRKEWGGYWSALIAGLARQRTGSYLLPQADTGFYRVNERAAVCTLTTEKTANLVIQTGNPEKSGDALELKFAQDSLGSPRQCIYFWPEVSGWHQLRLYSDEQQSVLDQKYIYVFGTGQWLAQQRQTRVMATRAKAINSASLPPDAHAKWVSRPVNLSWLWLTLVLSAALLWLERKLDSV